MALPAGNEWVRLFTRLSAMSDFTKSIGTIIFMLAPLIAGCIGIAIDMYIARTRYFNILTDALSNSYSLHFYTALWGDSSFKSRTMIVASMSGLLLFPSYSIKKGGLDADDARRFPVCLRRAMNTSSLLLCSGLMGCLVTVNLFMR